MHILFIIIIIIINLFIYLFIIWQDCETEPELDGDSSDDTIIYSPSKNSTNELQDVSSSDTTKTSTSYVECPLCLAFYPHYAIELHASQCAGDKAHDEWTVENNPILID